MFTRLKNTSIALLSLLPAIAIAQHNGDWFQHAAISPNGESIVFSYKGDIYSVNVAGGMARPLTIHSAWDGHPVWSHDGKQIAFASDRYGNLDVFAMPSLGGKALRLSFHSANDVPSDFSPNNKAVLFSSGRTDPADSSIFPTRHLTELYEVSLKGGTPRMVSGLPLSEARYSKDGNRIIYRDEKSYENVFRKRDTSAFARDIWVHDLKTGTHRQLTHYAGGDHTPVWDGNNGVFYLSENGQNNFNVWHMDLTGKHQQQISHFKARPVRSLSASHTGVLAYTHHGSIYTQSHNLGKNEKPKRVDITFGTDTDSNDYQTTQVNKDIREFSVSPNGKEIAFIARGEVFVSGRDFNTTKRITNTAAQERSVSFHQNGRTLLYASERDGKWKLYEASIADEGEKYFFAATKISEQEIHRAKTESFQPVYSPNGKKVAFLAGRDEIQVLDRTTGHTNVALAKKHNYSSSDGDLTFAWSADSNWLIAHYLARSRFHASSIGIFPADGSAEPVDISQSGYDETHPFWGRSGDIVVWTSSRYGQRDHGSWGYELDVMATFLNQDAYNKFTLSKEEYELSKELKLPNVNTAGATGIEWQGMEDRTVRLTKDSADIHSAMLSNDSSALFFVKKRAKGSELWQHNLREDSTKLIKKFGTGGLKFQLTNDGKSIVMLANGSLSYLAVDAPKKSKAISVDAIMELKPEAERAHMFEHAWRQIKDKFYEPNFHGVDWDAMKVAYSAKLPSISNNRDLANFLAEMTGELNASHIGASFRPKAKKSNDNTAALGAIFDLSDTSGALPIAEVLDKSPLSKANNTIKAGMKLTAIDGVKLGTGTNLALLLNNKTGKRVRLTIADTDGRQFDEVVNAISAAAQAQLMYERWVKTRKELVEKLSSGRLGYVHVRSMTDASYRVVYSEVLGRNVNKEAMVIDTRWNGGGWLHNDLAKFFMGKEYMTLHVRGREYRGDSYDQWNKPSILVISEGNYSDAHAFPYAYNVLKIGDMVGMPVPGTMSAVWWEYTISDDIRFGVPQIGMKNTEREYLENNQTEPDYKIKNDPESTAKGQDKQIEKAVEVMLRTLANGSK